MSKSILPRLLTIATILLMVSCEVTDIYTKNKINGVWVLESINGTKVNTSARIVYEFNNDKNALFAMRYEKSETYKSQWIEIKDYEWDLVSTNLQINGVDAKGETNAISAVLQTVNDTLLSFKVSGRNLGDNTEDTDNNLVFKRVVKQSNLYVGTWDMIQKDDVSKTDVRITFNEDGTYIYLEYVDGNWLEKQDNNGQWFTYGSIIATNYTLNGEKVCDVWDFDTATSGQVITWIWTMNNGDTKSSVIFRKVN
ncbi:MAG: hypothetical protein EOL95_07495 [Bacteroidia bacterium]|nr:hypothetical protein [Bacteroidia bacterium]